MLLQGAVAQVNSLAAAQVKPEKPVVRIGYASQSGAFAQLWIAAQKNYFNAEGLNAEILFTRTVTGVQAMIAGELDFVATGCPELFRAKRQGFDLRVVADFAPVNVYLIASRKEINESKTARRQKGGSQSVFGYFARVGAICLASRRRGSRFGYIYPGGLNPGAFRSAARRNGGWRCAGRVVQASACAARLE